MLLKNLLPLLTVSLTEDGGASGGSGGGDAGAGDSSTDGKGSGSSTSLTDKAGGDDKSTKGAEGDKTADKSTDAKGDAKADDKAKGDDAAVKAKGELTKSYEGYKFKLPEGMPIDAKAFEPFKAKFIERGIKPEVAQELVDLFVGGEKSRLEAVAKGLREESASWEKALKADEELAGKDGKALDATMASARRAMGKLATPGFRELLDKSGLARNPEMIRIMARAGKGMAEDTVKGTRSEGKGPEKTPEQKLRARYDHPTSKQMFNDAG